VVSLAVGIKTDKCRSGSSWLIHVELVLDRERNILSKESEMSRKIQSNSIKINGSNVHYYITGEGEPLVIIHGCGGSAKAWLKNATILSGRYTVYVPDLPGFGESQSLDGEYSIPVLANFVDVFTKEVGLDSYYLAGHSVGGGVALHCALKSPHKVKKLVLISSLCLGKEISFWVRFASILARRIGNGVMAVPLGIKWLDKMLSAPVKHVKPSFLTSVNLCGRITTYEEQRLVLVNQLSELMIPTLVVWGAKDATVPVKHAYTAAQVIPGCQLKVFEGSGHSVYRDDVARFSQVLTGFLN
jgi:pimeloyl-ACP methyl ester carboxylesterase